MKYYLVIFILVTGINLSAQTYHPFPTKNAMWTEMLYGPYPDYEVVFHSYALKDKDTTINSKVYHKLYHSTDTIFTEDELCGGLREENKRVYYYSVRELDYWYTRITPGTEVVLYDFSLELNDTITCDTFRIKIFGCLAVMEIDSILLQNGDYRMNYVFGFDDMLVPYSVWAEGIGYLRGLLFANGDLPLNGLWSDLICFKQDNKVLYHNDEYNYCYYLPDDLNSLQQKPKIKVAPNPLNSEGWIEFESGSLERLFIIDISGLVVREFNIAGKSSINIDSEGLSKGLYFIRSIDLNGNSQITKLVIE